MNVSPLLDVLLSGVLIGYVLYGIVRGLARSLLVILGILVALTTAVLITPLISAAIVVPNLRIVAIIASTITLIVLGHTIGHKLSGALRINEVNPALRRLDRITGGFALGLLVSLVLSTNSFNVGLLGSPLISRTFANSAVIQNLHDFTPHNVQSAIFRLRAVLSTERNPVFAGDFGRQNVKIAQIDAGSASLSAAAESVVRITGNSYTCGQAQTGTGFVVATDRIVTNAHVVAGLKRPVVEALNGQVLVGSVVHFDAMDDIAIIAVSGLDVSPLRKGITVASGASTEIIGYPFGGPLVASSAQVQSMKFFSSPNIYRLGASPREVYTLAGTVNPGDSGAPLLTPNGNFVGIVFSRAMDHTNVGYAMTLTELDPALANAAALTTAVSSGACIRD